MYHCESAVTHLKTHNSDVLKVWENMSNYDLKKSLSDVKPCIGLVTVADHWTLKQREHISGFKWSNYGIHSLQSAPEKARTNSQPLQQRYTFTRYGMNCIHQPTGKPLEWMGWINTNTGAAGYTKSLEGRIELIKDNSVSMTRLKLSGLKSEDSAVYYWVQ
uniref:Uncharacterized protein n=1 Tax=Oncorhynchus tshawytscha TaxID=74940 RepID=A0AAZ3NMH1_ONCTS